MDGPVEWGTGGLVLFTRGRLRHSQSELSHRLPELQPGTHSSLTPMSTAPDSDDSTVIKCNGPGCENHGRMPHFYRGRFCSKQCLFRARGRKALAGHVFDHCVCATCFRELKEIEEPKDREEFDLYTDVGFGVTDEGDQYREYFQRQDGVSKAAIGFQYRTEYANLGEKDHGDLVTTGTICTCGNTSHTHTDPDLATPADIERLVARLEADENCPAFDPHTLHVEWHLTHDRFLAMGRAIEAAKDASLSELSHHYCVECGAFHSQWPENHAITTSLTRDDVNHRRRRVGDGPLCSHECIVAHAETTDGTVLGAAYGVDSDD